MDPRDLPAKFLCSCIRSFSLPELAALTDEIVSETSPREGDLVYVETLSADGAYTRGEDSGGREIVLYPGDRFIGVMGTRKSSTNISAVLPDRQVEAGDVLELVAVGGLIAESLCVPAYLGGTALKVAVIGFPRARGSVLNLKGLVGPRPATSPAFSGDVYLVCGTSAECGKTALGCSITRDLKNRGAEVCFVKATGTGRLRDLHRYRDAGADHVADFVDVGWPSTYNIDSEDYVFVLDQLLGSAEGSDALVIELGGDLLEGNSDTALRFLGRAHANVRVFLVANDSMGAEFGLGLLSEHGFSDVLVGTMKQNVTSMSERLGGRTVIDVNRPGEVAEVIRREGAG